MKLIDFHTHCFPDKLAENALHHISGISHAIPCTNGTFSDLLAKMDEWKVDMAVCLNIATAPKQQHNVNEFALSIQDGKRIFSFGSVHAENADAVHEIYRMHEAGIKGIKLHPDYQNVELADRRMFPIYDACAELGMFCVFHSGWDPVSPDNTRVTPDKVLRLHKLFPRFRIILGHLGGLSLWNEVEEKLAGTGILMDTAYTRGMISPEQFTRIIQKHGAENIVFGSDCPWQSSRDTADFIDSLPISSQQKDKIFYQNALELLQIS
ncbi:MAG: amidohydrolase family protein [Candidatus Merdivicinus sp.]|jgi:predicted TIM-barrel fold metal-dependent hydrolase